MSTAGRRGNSEGTAPRKRPDGRWQIDLRYLDTDGTHKRTTVYGKTQAEARAKARAVRKRAELGQPVRDTKDTLGTFAREWITTALAASERKASTKDMNASVTRNQIVSSALGGTPLDKVTPRAVEGWLVELRARGLAESTVRIAYDLLSAILNTAVRDGALGRNPVAAVQRPRVTRREAGYLTPDQVRSVLSAAQSTRFAPLFELLVNTGLRRGEALALQWSDVDLEAGTLRVRGTLARVAGELVVTEPKTANSRHTVPLSDTAAQILRTVRLKQTQERLLAGSRWHQTGYVFTTVLGEPCDPRNALHAFKLAAKRAGVPGPVGLHTLRHSAASVMLVNGVPLKVVSDMLGHASVAITGDIYGHVSPDVSREAAAKLAAGLSE
jgi:integrase